VIFGRRRGGRSRPSWMGYSELPHPDTEHLMDLELQARGITDPEVIKSAELANAYLAAAHVIVMRNSFLAGDQGHDVLIKVAQLIATTSIARRG
jgi:hypothetical protein